MQAQLAQAEATLACDRSERSALERQLADALLAIELTHGELAKVTEQLNALRADAQHSKSEVEEGQRAVAAAEAAAASMQAELNKQQVMGC